MGGKLSALCAVFCGCTFVTVPGSRPMEPSEVEAQLVTVGAWSVRIGGELSGACVSRLERTYSAPVRCRVFEEVCMAGCYTNIGCLTFEDSEGGHDVVVISLDHGRYEPGYTHRSTVVHETIHQLSGCTHEYYWRDPYHRDEGLWYGPESVQGTANEAL